jgi:hypothetical protein
MYDLGSFRTCICQYFCYRLLCSHFAWHGTALYPIDVHDCLPHPAPFIGPGARTYGLGHCTSSVLETWTQLSASVLSPSTRSPRLSSSHRSSATLLACSLTHPHLPDSLAAKICLAQTEDEIYGEFCAVWRTRGLQLGSNSPRTQMIESASGGMLCHGSMGRPSWASGPFQVSSRLSHPEYRVKHTRRLTYPSHFEKNSPMSAETSSSALPVAPSFLVSDAGRNVCVIFSLCVKGCRPRVSMREFATLPQSFPRRRTPSELVPVGHAHRA